MTDMGDDEPLDIELWLAYRDGDATAFTALYRRHAASVLRYAWSIVHEQVAAEEVLQETFLTAWDKRRSTHIVDESFLPWLLVTCRNHSRNLVRRAAKHRSVPLELVAEPHAAQAAELDWIAVEIAKLSQSDRLLCQLCLIEGYTYAEAADVLDITRAAVGKRLQRVRARLAQASGMTE